MKFIRNFLCLFALVSAFEATAFAEQSNYASCLLIKSADLKLNLSSLAALIGSDGDGCPQRFVYKSQNLAAIEEYLAFGDFILHERPAPQTYEKWTDLLQGSKSVPSIQGSIYIDAYESAKRLSGDMTQICSGFIMIDINTLESASRQFCYDPE